MIFLGIDPGITGAIAVWDGEMNVLRFPTDTSITGKPEICLKAIDYWLGMWDPGGLAAIEEVHSTPQWSRVACFSLGRTFGQLLALLELQSRPFIRVAPQTWKGVILKGTKRDKAAAIAYVRQRYPYLGDDLSHDEADAVCICEYAKLQEGRL